MSVVFNSQSESDTDRFGAALANALPETAAIALLGTLGAGKTRLVQAVAASLGVEAEVTSPTFVLCQQYHGKRMIYHLDAYRLHDSDEFLELGVDEYFEGPGITFIEWADRVADCLPADRLEIHIEVTGKSSRTFTVKATGEDAESVVERLGL